MRMLRRAVLVVLGVAVVWFGLLPLANRALENYSLSVLTYYVSIRV